VDSGATIEHRRAIRRARYRRYRQRQREGVLVVPVEVREPIVEALISVGWLSAYLADNRESVRAAMQQLLDAFANNATRRDMDSE
jgi:hypothetical protein